MGIEHYVADLLLENSKLRIERERLSFLVKKLYSYLFFDRDCSSFVKDLIEHGLIDFAKKLIENNLTLEDIFEMNKYFLSEDIYYKIHECREDILKIKKAPRVKPKPMVFIY